MWRKLGELGEWALAVLGVIGLVVFMYAVTVGRVPLR
jgi:hypothetical protein